jgi:hypothetical protein
MSRLLYGRVAARIASNATLRKTWTAPMGPAQISSSHWLRVTGLLITLMIAGAGWDQTQARSPRHDPPKHAIHGPNYRPPYAAIVVDDKSGFVLHEVSAGEPRHPASLTKIMTRDRAKAAVRARFVCARCPPNLPPRPAPWPDGSRSFVALADRLVQMRMGESGWRHSKLVSRRHSQ